MDKKIIGDFWPGDYIKNIPKAIYKEVERRQDGVLYQDKNGLTIIISGEIHESKKWIHVSFSRKNRMPEYRDMERIKKHFIGEHERAVMIFPEKENHVNIMNYALHLYCCCDDSPIPEFSFNGSI
jgi:hypothetical protein